LLEKRKISLALLTKPEVIPNNKMLNLQPINQYFINKLIRFKRRKLAVKF
jgi:helix-turn-helix protein